VALGFECPLFVPIAVEETHLTRARPGEGSRPWSAGAGCGALATGLVQAVWVLQTIRAQLTSTNTAHLDWEAFSKAESGLFLWEAFVSGKGKTATHVSDAQAAVNAFADSLPNPMAFNAVTCTVPVHSLIGAALLRTGWSSTPAVMSMSCLVIKAKVKDD